MGTFDIDANGILNVSAADKSTGKVNKITITNDKGRLSKEEIERMVNDAEKFKDEDEQQKERIAAKNSLESYIFNLKSSLDEEQIKSKLSEDEAKSISTALDNSLSWLDTNQLAETEEFKDKLKDLENLVNPIMSRIHQGGQQNGQTCGQQSQHFGQNNPGPTVEEMD